MDRISELELLWNDKIEAIEKQAKTQLQSHEFRIQNRADDLQRLDVLQSHIRTLKVKIESDRRFLAETEALPNFRQLRQDYLKSKGEENKLEMEKKSKDLNKLVDRYRQALGELDIEQAQALLEQLELGECSAVPELKNELIEAIKKL